MMHRHARRAGILVAVLLCLVALAAALQRGNVDHANMDDANNTNLDAHNVNGRTWMARTCTHDFLAGVHVFPVRASRSLSRRCRCQSSGPSGSERRMSWLRGLRAR